MSIHFTVQGTPKAQPRVKAARRGGFVHVYTPNGADEWKKKVRDAYAAMGKREKISRAVELTLYFFIARPKSHFSKSGALKPTAPAHPICKPDIDNLSKAVMDALSDAWADDSVVTRLNACKQYGSDGTESEAERLEGCCVRIDY